ncbi:ABC transporter substrate-binding protein [Nonomuraea muscovyensis]|uniref:Multiple sugar transport system substrate-binding protein n=1 Tax=Nonomuraea muscovyensis TaxID=1124761 RepID=A0A7X0C274_9ACTN|nr:sugar ABC transporter substrate-binding protein [Nonomuraea muscovyensis]MBB6345329.1 multiple sugar transport system substrate-binding protein [Nonomuraea muscovyensis]MDF2706396.1 extracellular solute-binding protein family 1 [Nonomuraea muscovyensis]
MTGKVWALVCAGALVAGLAGCSSSDGADAGGKVTLTYAYWDEENQGAAMRKITEEFTKAHPDIEVKLQFTPNKEYWTKLQTAAAGGTAPDVFWMNGPRIGLYASQGALLPLSDRIAKDKLDLGKYPKSLVDLYTLDGKQYGIPKDFDTIGLWYNKDLFDAAGVKYPDASWTWDDVRDAAKRLTDPAKGVHGIGAMAWSQELYYNTIFQAGGHVISEDKKKSGYDDPATIEGLKFWKDLLDRKLSPTVQQMTDNDPIEMFKSGKLAMWYDGSYDAAQYNKTEGLNADVAPLPAGPKGKATVIHGLANVIYAKTEHPEQAWEFLKFLGSEQANRIQAESGAVIPAYEGLQDSWVKSMPKLNLQAFIDQLPDARPYPVSKNTAAWARPETDAITKAFSDGQDVEAIAREFAATMNAALSQEK